MLIWIMSPSFTVSCLPMAPRALVPQGQVPHLMWPVEGKVNVTSWNVKTCWGDHGCHVNPCFSEILRSGAVQDIVGSWVYFTPCVSTLLKISVLLSIYLRVSGLWAGMWNMWTSKTERWSCGSLGETEGSMGPGVQKDLDSSISCSEAHVWVLMSRPQPALLNVSVLWSVYLWVRTVCFHGKREGWNCSLFLSVSVNASLPWLKGACDNPAFHTICHLLWHLAWEKQQKFGSNLKMDYKF